MTSPDPENVDDTTAASTGIAPTTSGQWLALLAAVALLAAFAGYLFGQRETYPSDRSLEVGFLVDMIDHHDQAVQLSLMEIRNGANSDVQHFAHEILRQQSVEIGLMTQKLEDWGKQRRAEVGPAMVWMDHEHRSDAMPGMASPEEMEALGLARGAEADALFVRLMQDHHVGGADMAQYAADHTANAFVKDLAARMASVQRKEIQEMEQARKRAGLPESPGAWVPAFPR